MGKIKEIRIPYKFESSRIQDVLLNISQSIIGTLDYEKVLQIISDGMSALLEIETAAIYLLENEKEIYLGATTPPLDPDMPNDFRRALINDHPHIHKTIKTRKPYVILDTGSAKLSQSEKVVVELRNLRSLLFLPFIQEKEVLGILILGTCNKSREFSKEEIDLGQTVANQLSIGIQNALLHHDLFEKNIKLEKEIKERLIAENSLLEAKIKLEQSEHMYRSLFDQAAEGILLMDMEGKLVQVNRAFAEMHGYSVDEIKKMNITDLDVLKEGTFLDRDDVKKKVMAGETVQMEVEHYHKDGHVFPLYVIIQILRLNEENYSLCFHQDMTNQKRIEKELKNHHDNIEKMVMEKTAELDNAIEELKTVNDELFNKNKIINKQNTQLKRTLKNLKEAQSRLIQSEKMASLGILTAGVAHEINNPLNYIMGSYLALESYFKENQCKDQDLIDKLMFSLRTGLDKATDIVKGLNLFSRENQAFNEDCEIQIILENCLTILSNRIKDRINVSRQFTEDNPVVKGNVGQLHRAFLNILTNAVQAIENIGKIDIATRRKGDLVIIEIKDSGAGVDKENLTKITDPFFTTKDPGEGTGLGLSITYSIIMDHKGSMEFSSTKGKGTRVKISLPINR